MTLLPFRRTFLGILGILAVCVITPARAGPSSADVFADPKAAALADAALTRNVTRAAELVRAGASPNARGDRGVTLLQWTMLQKSLIGFGILLNLGADPTRTGLDGDSAVHFAAKANDTAYLRMLLDRHVDVDVRNASTGRTPVMEALMGNRTVQVEMLRNAGARLDVSDHMGNTPLHVAAQIGASAEVLAFLEQGAPPRARNRQGKTFQTYVFMTPERVLTERARADRRAVADWLVRHGIALER